MPSPSQHNESELLKLISNGDEIAFTELFERYSDNLYSVALAYIKSPEIAEELVQDVFVKLWQKREESIELQSLKNFLFITLRNEIWNVFRSQKREKKYLEELKRRFSSMNATPEEITLFRQSNEILEKGIRLLPPQQKTIFELSKKEGIKLTEIAKQLGLSRNTVRNHHQAALKFMRDFLRQNHVSELLICLFSFLNYLI